MLEVIIKRILAAVPLLLLLSVFAFLLMKAIPGDPVDVLVGNAARDMSGVQLSALREEMGLNQPLPKQYLGWLENAVCRGELGRSYKDGQKVLLVIGQCLPCTLVLVGLAIVLAFTLGIGLGLTIVFLSLSPLTSKLAQALSALAVILYSLPTFWLGILSLFFVVRYFHFLPVLSVHSPGSAGTFWQLFLHAALPAFILALRRAAKIALFVKSTIIDELSQDYVLTALSKGLTRAEVLWRHVFRNSLTPLIALAALSLPSLLGGSVLIETVFGLPGMGRLAVDAAFGRNYPVLMALVMIYGASVVAGSLICDIVQISFDPRLQNELGALKSKAGRA